MLFLMVLQFYIQIHTLRFLKILTLTNTLILLRIFSCYSQTLISYRFESVSFLFRNPCTLYITSLVQYICHSLCSTSSVTSDTAHLSLLIQYICHSEYSTFVAPNTVQYIWHSEYSTSVDPYTVHYICHSLYSTSVIPYSVHPTLPIQ